MVARPRAESVGANAAEFVNFDRDRTSLLLKNDGSTDVFLGVDPSLTIANGFELSAGQAITYAKLFGDNPRVSRFAIAAVSGTLRISEEHADLDEMKDTKSSPGAL